MDINFGLDLNKLKKICCLYAFVRGENFSRYSFKISKNMLNFGDYVVRINDSSEFLRLSSEHLKILRFPKVDKNNNIMIIRKTPSG